jgi:hypothetical protein
MAGNFTEFQFTNMHMKKLIILSVILLVAIIARPQKNEKKSCSCSFQSMLNIGLLEGQENSDFLIQTINGIQYKGWFAGIGAGIDYYRFRSIPLFLDIRKNILNKNLSPFVYADAGIHFPWAKDNESFYGGSKMSNGLYYDAGIGMNFSIRKNQGFTFSAGYSYKFAKETASWPIYCVMGPCPEYKQTRSYDLNRLSMKLGWRINS